MMLSTKKIENQQELTSDDYSAMVDYMEDCLNNVPKDVENDAANGEWMEKNYPHYVSFAMTLGMADMQGNLDSSLKERLKKIEEKLGK